MLTLVTDNKSILTDSDWKKLWKEADNINLNGKSDNNLDTTDSPMFEDSEVSEKCLIFSQLFFVFFYFILFWFILDTLLRNI